MPTGIVGGGVVVDGGGPGRQQGGDGVAREAPPWRNGAVAEQIGFELRLLICCSWVKEGR